MVVILRHVYMPIKGQKDLSPAFKTTFNSYILSLSFPSMIAESAARCGIDLNQAGISDCFIRVTVSITITPTAL
jgi:hypothetical protein